MSVVVSLRRPRRRPHHPARTEGAKMRAGGRRTQNGHRMATVIVVSARDGGADIVWTERKLCCTSKATNVLIIIDGK